MSRTRWYGWQTLVGDAAAVGLFALGVGLNDRDNPSKAVALYLTSAGTFAFQGPIVHAAHGHWGRAGASLGLRVGLPLLGLATTLGIETSCQNQDGGCGGAEVGALIFLFGVVTASALDAALLGNERVVAPAQNQPAVTFAPTLLRGGGAVSLAARF